jgi:hypothetical protein
MLIQFWANVRLMTAASRTHAFFFSADASQKGRARIQNVRSLEPKVGGTGTNENNTDERTTPNAKGVFKPDDTGLTAGARRACGP